MFMHDNKSAVASIMTKHGSAKPALDASKPADSLDGESADGRHAAAQDILAAMKDMNAERLSKALANFHDIHASFRSEE